MPERTAGDISSSEDESSYEEVVVEEPKPVEPEPELPGDTTSSEETTSDESTKKRTREVEGPRGELRGRPKNRSPETRREGRALPEGRDKRPRSPEPPAGRDKRPRSPSPPAGRDKRPRSPEPPEGGKAKGKSKGKKGAQQYVPCPICRTQVKNNVCSKDQHQYWSVWCNTWRRYNAGMTWNLAQAAAERQKRRRERRERREQQGEEIPAKHRKGKEVARKEKAEKKKGDKGKKDKKEKKGRRGHPAQAQSLPGLLGRKAEDLQARLETRRNPAASRGSRKQWTKVYHWVQLWELRGITMTCGSYSAVWLEATRRLIEAWALRYALGSAGPGRAAAAPPELVSFVQDVDTTWEQIWFIFVPRNCKYIISLIKLESF